MTAVEAKEYGTEEGWQFKPQIGGFGTAFPMHNRIRDPTGLDSSRARSLLAPEQYETDPSILPSNECQISEWTTVFNTGYVPALVQSNAVVNISSVTPCITSSTASRIRENHCPSPRNRRHTSS